MANRPTRSLLLGATFGTDNMGVGALTAGALRALQHRDPQGAVSFLDYGYRPTVSEVRIDDRRVSVPLINLRFTWKLWLPNNIAGLLARAALARMLPAGLRARLIRGNRWLAAIDEADDAVAMSGGDSFSDIYGLGRFFYVTLPQVLLVLMGKPYTLLPQTLGPFEGRVARTLARWVMRHARIVYSRDAQGVGEARRLLGLSASDGKVRFGYDLGFVLDPRQPRAIDLGGFEQRAGRRPCVGLNVSGLLLIGGYGGGNDFALQVDYATLVGRILEFLIEERDVDVLLVPHVFGVQRESDLHAMETIHARHADRYPGRLFKVHGHYDPHEIKHIIGRCDFFIGSRMHACIAALSQGVPAVAVAYSRKFAGVLDSIGAGDLVADPRTLDAASIVGLIGARFDRRDAIRAELTRAMPTVRERALNVLVGGAHP